MAAVPTPDPCCHPAQAWVKKIVPGVRFGFPAFKFIRKAQRYTKAGRNISKRHRFFFQIYFLGISAVPNPQPQPTLTRSLRKRPADPSFVDPALRIGAHQRHVSDDPPIHPKTLQKR